MDAKRSLVRKWLTKARRDLLSAKRLARGPDPYFDTAIYHCQQCVEKAVKGWLVYYDQSFEKTHDLQLDEARREHHRLEAELTALRKLQESLKARKARPFAVAAEFDRSRAYLAAPGCGARLGSGC